MSKSGILSFTKSLLTLKDFNFAQWLDTKIKKETTQTLLPPSHQNITLVQQGVT